MRERPHGLVLSLRRLSLMALRSSQRFVLGLMVACSLLGCSKKRPPASLSTAPPPSTTAPESEDGSFAQFGSESSNNSGISSSDINRGLANDSAPSDLERIHFDYDKSDLTPAARQILDKDAAFLHSHDSVVVEVGGHCDERGSTDYNIALGERRAQTASRYLRELGIESGKLKVVSYGEDRPLSFGHT